MGKIAQFVKVVENILGIVGRQPLPAFLLTTLFFETLNIMLTSTVILKGFLHFGNSWRDVQHIGGKVHETTHIQTCSHIFWCSPNGWEHKFVTCLMSSNASSTPFTLSFSDSFTIGSSFSLCRWIKALYFLCEMYSDTNLYVDILQIISTYFLIPPSPQKECRGWEWQLSLVLTHLKAQRF